MPVPQQDARSTARCPFHSKMLVRQQDARSTVRCLLDSKMLIPQNYSNHSIIKQSPCADISQGRAKTRCLDLK
ncbi:MAG: hypothetical protein F6J90_11785 [Moorea sp. SIOASIH]|nr:hypothetical protein [Moorena sp. SIOASIH]